MNHMGLLPLERAIGVLIHSLCEVNLIHDHSNDQLHDIRRVGRTLPLHNSGEELLVDEVHDIYLLVARRVFSAMEEIVAII
jgi:hypothetical protein